MPELQPPEQAIARAPNAAPVALRIILAIVLGLPALAGFPALIFAYVWWASSDFYFSAIEGGWVLFLIIPGIALILFSVIGISIVLRFARWQRATKASLVLAGVAAISVVVAYTLSLSALKLTETWDQVGLLLLATIALAVAALPPFLHWWKSR